MLQRPEPPKYPYKPQLSATFSLKSGYSHTAVDMIDIWARKRIGKGLDDIDLSTLIPMMIEDGLVHAEVQTQNGWRNKGARRLVFKFRIEDPDRAETLREWRRSEKSYKKDVEEYEEQMKSYNEEQDRLMKKHAKSVLKDQIRKLQKELDQID